MSLLAEVMRDHDPAWVYWVLGVAMALAVIGGIMKDARNSVVSVIGVFIFVPGLLAAALMVIGFLFR